MDGALDAPTRETVHSHSSTTRNAKLTIRYATRPTVTAFLFLPRPAVTFRKPTAMR